jgi:hypothetical protein
MVRFRTDFRHLASKELSPNNPIVSYPKAQAHDKVCSVEGGKLCLAKRPLGVNIATFEMSNNLTGM